MPSVISFPTNLNIFFKVKERLGTTFHMWIASNLNLIRLYRKRCIFPTWALHSAANLWKRLSLHEPLSWTFFSSHKPSSVVITQCYSMVFIIALITNYWNNSTRNVRNKFSLIKSNKCPSQIIKFYFPINTFPCQKKVITSPLWKPIITSYFIPLCCFGFLSLTRELFKAFSVCGESHKFNRFYCRD